MHRADRRAALADAVEIALEERGLVLVRTEKRIARDLVPVPFGAIDLVRTHLHQRAAHFHTGQDLAGDRAGCDPRRGFARRRAAAATIIAQAIFGFIGEVGMSWAKLVLDLGIVLRALVGVLDQKRDRRSRRDLHAGLGMRHHAGQDLDRIRLLALRGEARLAGPAAIEIALDVLIGQRDQRRAAIDHAADRDPVALAKGRDPEHVAEGVEGHRCLGAPALTIRVYVECQRFVTRTVEGVKCPFFRHGRARPGHPRLASPYGLQGVDARDKPGHDGSGFNYTSATRRRETRRPRPARSGVSTASSGVARPSATISARMVPPWATVDGIRLSAESNQSRIRKRAHWHSSRPPARRRSICRRRARRRSRRHAACISGQRQTFPLAVTDLAQAVVDGVVGRRQIQRAAHQFHGRPRAAERACDERQADAGAAVARQQAAEDFAGMRPPGCGRDR